MITGRSRWEIIFDVLKVVQGSNNAKKKHIMKKANLDSKNFKNYLSFLVLGDFVMIDDQETGYKITEKGMELFRRLKDFEGFVGKTGHRKEDPVI
jgi:predicted transcriptional regulator